MHALFLTLAALTAPLHALLVLLPGPHSFGHALLLAVGGWLLALTVMTQTREEAPEVLTLNADDLFAGSDWGGFHTLGSTPIWAKKCAVPYCEHTEAGCFCAEDCECAFHAEQHGDLGFVQMGSEPWGGTTFAALALDEV